MQNNLNRAATRDRQLVEGVIANLPLFGGVAPAGFAVVAHRSWTLPVARGTTIIEQTFGESSALLGRGRRTTPSRCRIQSW